LSPSRSLYASAIAPILLAGSSAQSSTTDGDLERGAAAGGRRQTRHADAGEGAGEHREGPRPATGARWRVGESGMGGMGL
jgi:hypothetical protein